MTTRVPPGLTWKDFASLLPFPAVEDSGESCLQLLASLRIRYSVLVFQYPGYTFNLLSGLLTQFEWMLPVGHIVTFHGYPSGPCSFHVEVKKRGVFAGEFNRIAI
jgi:hypothetical protein